VAPAASISAPTRRRSRPLDARSGGEVGPLPLSGGQAGFEPENKRVGHLGALDAQWNQRADLWLPTLDTFRTFLSQASPDYLSSLNLLKPAAAKLGGRDVYA